MANLLLLADGRRLQRRSPQNREYTLRDTRQPGLALRVQPCGSRSWIMRYRINGKPVRHLLGTFPETGVKAARQIAAALRAQDAEAPAVPSTGPLFEAFQAEHERRYAALYKPEGLRAYRSYVRCELLPAFAETGGCDHPTRCCAVVREIQRKETGGANRALAFSRKSFAAPKHGGMYPRRGAIP
jgi:hypothetical protein